MGDVSLSDAEPVLVADGMEMEERSSLMAVIPMPIQMIGLPVSVGVPIELVELFTF